MRNTKLAGCMLALALGALPMTALADSATGSDRVPIDVSYAGPVAGTEAAATRITCQFPDGVWPKPVVTLSNYKSDAYIPGSLRVYGTGPATLSMSVGRSSTAGEQLGGSVSVEASAVFAKVSATASTSISRSRTLTTTSTYAIQIPSGKSMYIEAGAHGLGYRASVKRISAATCNYVTLLGDVKYPKASGAIWYTQGTTS